MSRSQTATIFQCAEPVHLHCRAQVTHWDGLPSDLSVLILKKLEDCFYYWGNGRACLQEILALRLVSKAWKQAASAYNGKAYIEAQKENDLLDLIRLLPHINELRIQSQKALCIKPVSALNQLSSLSISRRESGGPPLDMSLLPMSLEKLKASNYRLNPNSFQNLLSMQLTSLELDKILNSPTEKRELLQCLPGLQV